MMVLVINIGFLVPKAAALPPNRDSGTIPTGTSTRAGPR
jgi:hypothetical protein